MKNIKIFINESELGGQDISEHISPKNLEKIYSGYIAAAIFTEEEQYNTREFEELDVEDFERHKSHILKDILSFLKMAGAQPVDEAVNENGYSQLGHDIWLTRNGHGAGFFDRGYDSDIEERLMNAAQKLGESYPYQGDDGRLYFMDYQS